MIQIHHFNEEEHYPILQEWWKAHGWNPVPAGMLKTLGLIACVDSEPVAACFLYMSNSCGVCMLEWIVTKPGIPGRQAVEAIDAMIGFMAERARALDYNVMLSTCRQESLGRLLTRNGFEESDSNVKHFVRVLQPS